MDEKVKIEFDIFAIQIALNASSLDEMVMGYFFGKKNEDLEYTFFTFPASIKQKIPELQENSFFKFKEEISDKSNQLIPDHPEIVERTSKVINYLDIQFSRIGGLKQFSKRLSYLVEIDDREEISLEILGLFNNWVEKKELKFFVQTYTFEEYSKQTLINVDLASISQKERDYLELTKMTEYYPLIDPINGMSIDSFKVGMPLRLAVLSFPDKDTEEKVKEQLADYVDERDGFLKPVEGIILSKELLKGKDEIYILVKVSLTEDICAYSIILKSLKLTKEHLPDYNILPPLKKEDNVIPSGEGHVFKKRAFRTNRVINKLKETAKFKFVDLMILIIIIGGLTALMAIILDLLSKK